MITQLQCSKGQVPDYDYDFDEKRAEFQHFPTQVFPDLHDKCQEIPRNWEETGFSSPQLLWSKSGSPDPPKYLRGKRSGTTDTALKLEGDMKIFGDKRKID